MEGSAGAGGPAHVHMCVCTVSMPPVHGGKKKASDSLPLELQVVVGHYIWALCNNTEATALNC